jgi:hypothetical protein
MAAGKKEVSWEFVHETSGKKYFLVKKSDTEYFVFRTPATISGETKDDYTLSEWEGEIVPWGGVWGGVPVKVRGWLARKKIKPDTKNQKILVPQS